MTSYQTFSMPASFIAFCGSGLAMNHFHRLPVCEVLRSEQCHADIESKRIGRYPAGGRIECVGKTVLAPDLVAVLILHRMHRRDADVRRQHQRAPRRARNHTAIGFGVQGRPSPRLVTLGAGRACNAPDVLRVRWELFRHLGVTPLAMRAGSDLAVLPTSRLCRPWFRACRENRTTQTDTGTSKAAMLPM